MGIIDFYHKMMTEKRELIMYLFFGCLTTLVSWLSYAAFVHMGIDINISNALSWVCGVLFAFVTNKWFVFMSRSRSVKILLYELGSFFSARIVTGVIAIILFPILYALGLNQSLFNTDGFLAKVVTSVVEIILNWVFSKYIVFRNKNKEEPVVENEQS